MDTNYSCLMLIPFECTRQNVTLAQSLFQVIKNTAATTAIWYSALREQRCLPLLLGSHIVRQSICYELINGPYRFSPPPPPLEDRISFLPSAWFQFLFYFFLSIFSFQLHLLFTSLIVLYLFLSFQSFSSTPDEGKPRTLHFHRFLGHAYLVIR